MNVDAPSLVVDHPDRQLECEHALDMPVRVLVDEAITKGWTAEEVCASLVNVIAAQHIAYGHDPDPAGD
ncbi:MULTISPECIES: hypothetical protein [unclassified Aminobacter]|uniref:hypothetical protein n=1 Tax=unclassified Aminobacter TaxID=2644704 RepID=UPI0004673536|nr:MULTISPECIES: hypothetical protein [unclassified Aminobacter]TWH28084.1 hypothetical protein L611_004700000080 [Aminobacter sp. J15]